MLTNHLRPRASWLEIPAMVLLMAPCLPAQAQEYEHVALAVIGDTAPDTGGTYAIVEEEGFEGLAFNDSGAAAFHARVAGIDLFYVSNLYFLEGDQLVRDAPKLRDIPVTLIVGRYDMASPALAAYRIHEQLPQSKLIIVERAGHSESEEGITTAIVAAGKEFE